MLSPRNARHRAFFAALTLLMCAQPHTAMAAPAAASAAQAVAAEFRRQMAAHQIVGGALVVLGPEQTYVEEHYGMADRERAIAADENTIYSWGSVTKTLTSIAIMQLNLRGRLQIDNAFVGYVPAFARIDNPYRNTDHITIKMLLSHTAGLQNPSFIVPLSPHTVWPDWPQMVAAMDYLKVEHPPGTAYKYSNLGLTLAGRLIDEVTQDEYETYMDKNLYKPLQMHDSYHDVAPYHLEQQRAQGYRQYDGQKEWQQFGPDYDQGATSSNGGFMAHVRDMKKYARFLLGAVEPAQRERYERILPRKVLESMWEPLHALDDPKRGSIGLGFHVFTDLKHTYIGHGGSGNGFRCEVVFEPTTRTAILIVGNTENLKPVHSAVRATIDRELIPALLATHRAGQGAP